MSLNNVLRTATMEDLKKVTLFMLNNYARRNHETLTFFYDNGIIDDSSIEEVLEESVFRQARQYYKAITRKGRPYTIWADHIGKPEYLAYALKKNKFSKKEIKQIPFDHGESAETFPQYYGRENLLSILREELLNPKPLPKFEGYYDPHPVCEC